MKDNPRTPNQHTKNGKEVNYSAVYTGKRTRERRRTIKRRIEGEPEGGGGGGGGERDKERGRGGSTQRKGR